MKSRIISRKPTGTAGAVSVPSSIAAPTWRWLSSPHRAQCRMCCLTLQRRTTVGVPAERSRITARSGQYCRSKLAAWSIPSDFWTWARARDASVCAWSRDTPRMAPRSAPWKSCRRFSSLISRSTGSRSASAACTKPSSSACSVIAENCAVSSIAAVAS